jgi:hypothetical protein
MFQTSARRGEENPAPGGKTALVLVRVQPKRFEPSRTPFLMRSALSEYRFRIKRRPRWGPGPLALMCRLGAGGRGTANERG